MLPGLEEILELEDPGVVPGQILIGVPWGCPEAFQSPVFLEPGGQRALSSSCAVQHDLKAQVTLPQCYLNTGCKPYLHNTGLTPTLE